MGFLKMEDSNKSLSISDFDLPNNEIDGKIGLVVKVNSGVTKNDSSGFFTFKIKTVESEIVLGSVFNLENFILSGLDAYALQGKFVKVSGKTSTFYNGRNIVLSSIEEVPAIEVSDKEKFIGVIPNLDELFDRVQGTFTSWENALNETSPDNEQVSFKFPTPFKSKRFVDVKNGVVGGYVSFVYSWMCTSLVCMEEVPDWILFARTFYYSVIAYSQVLERLDILNVLTPAEVSEFVYNSRFAVPDWDSEAKLIVGDIMNAILSGASPQHLYAHAIVNAFNYVREWDGLVQSWVTLPEGGAVLLGNQTLRKY